MVLSADICVPAPIQISPKSRLSEYGQMPLNGLEESYPLMETMSQSLAHGLSLWI